MTKVTQKVSNPEGLGNVSAFQVVDLSVIAESLYIS
jgi:hypothetical protein